jgi:hypothetical protein
VKAPPGWENRVDRLIRKEKNCNKEGEQYLTTGNPDYQTGNNTHCSHYYVHLERNGLDLTSLRSLY